MQMLGSLGLETTDRAMMGDRQSWSIFNTVSVPPTSAASLTMQSPPFSLTSDGALWIESVSGAVFPNDALGFITVNSLIAKIFDSTGADCEILQLIAPVSVAFAKLSGQNMGFFISPSPPLRQRDLRQLQSSTAGFGSPSVSPYTVRIVATFTNADAAAHAAGVSMTGHVRIMQGVTP